ncbi:hypothetical protein A2U01_0070085, partial [Trifolium medium]|nr:hypothetical protein [Trifolium medium]
FGTVLGAGRSPLGARRRTRLCLAEASAGRTRRSMMGAGRAREPI